MQSKPTVPWAYTPLLSAPSVTYLPRYRRYDDDTDGLLSFDEFKGGFKPLISFQMEELKRRLTEKAAKEERLKLEKSMAKQSLERESMLDRVSQHIDDKMDAVGAVATKAAEGSIGVVGAVGKGVGKGVVGVGRGVGKGVVGVGKGAMDGALDVGKGLTTTVSKAAGSTIGVVTDVGKGIGSSVAGVGKGLTTTVTKAAGSTIGAVADVGKGITSTVSKALPFQHQQAEAAGAENEHREPEPTEQILPPDSEDPEIDEVDQFLREEEQTQKIGVG